MTIADINTKTRSLCDADSTSFTDANLLIEVNTAIETIVGKIIQICKHFTFDDENFANIAQGGIALEEGISKYTITDKFLNILEVKVRDKEGYFHIVVPKTQKETDSVLETLEAETGLPTQYRAIGRTIFLAPAPTATLVTLSKIVGGLETGGLKFSYTRTSYQITASDVTTGTLVPGIASPWHITICKIAALSFCKTYKKDRVPQLERDIQDEIYGRYGLLAFYSNRQQDRIPRLIANEERND